MSVVNHSPTNDDPLKDLDCESAQNPIPKKAMGLIYYETSQGREIKRPYGDRLEELWMMHQVEKNGGTVKRSSAFFIRPESKYASNQVCMDDPEIMESEKDRSSKEYLFQTFMYDCVQYSMQGKWGAVTLENNRTASLEGYFLGRKLGVNFINDMFFVVSDSEDSHFDAADATFAYDLEYKTIGQTEEAHRRTVGIYIHSQMNIPGNISYHHIGCLCISGRMIDHAIAAQQHDSNVLTPSPQLKEESNQHRLYGYLIGRKLRVISMNRGCYVVEDSASSEFNRDDASKALLWGYYTQGQTTPNDTNKQRTMGISLAGMDALKYIIRELVDPHPLYEAKRMLIVLRKRNEHIADYQFAVDINREIIEEIKSSAGKKNIKDEESFDDFPSDCRNGLLRIQRKSPCYASRLALKCRRLMEQGQTATVRGMLKHY